MNRSLKVFGIVAALIFVSVISISRAEAYCGQGEMVTFKERVVETQTGPFITENSAEFQCPMQQQLDINEAVFELTLECVSWGGHISTAGVGDTGFATLDKACSAQASTNPYTNVTSYAGLGVAFVLGVCCVPW